MTYQVHFELSGESHGDHLTAEQMAEVLRRTEAGRFESITVPPQAGIFIGTIRLSERVAPTMNALRGPLSGEEAVDLTTVSYAKRNGRPNLSCMTTLPSQPTRLVTVIVGALENTEAGCWNGTLFTAYGGPSCPQEPGDPHLPESGLGDAREFWTTHALSLDGSPEAEEVEGATVIDFLAATKPAEEVA